MPSHNHTRGTMNITGQVGQGFQTTSINGGWHNYGNSGHGSGALYLSGTSYGSSCTWNSYNDSGLITLDASRSWTGATSNTGGSTPIDITPPYKAVNIWQRIE